MMRSTIVSWGRRDEAPSGRTRILRDDRQPRAQVEEAYRGDVDAVDNDGARVSLDEAEEGRRQRRLAAARRTDDADLLASLDRERQAVEDVGQLGCVADVQVLDLDVASRPVRGRARLDDLGGLQRCEVSAVTPKTDHQEPIATHLLLDLAKLLCPLDADHRELELGIAPNEEEDVIRDVEGEREGEAGEGCVNLVARRDENVAGQGDDRGTEEREAHRQPAL